MRVAYKNDQYHVVSMSTWGSVELVTLRPVGSLHTITVPLCNVERVA